MSRWYRLVSLASTGIEYPVLLEDFHDLAAWRMREGPPIPPPQVWVESLAIAAGDRALDQALNSMG